MYCEVTQDRKSPLKKALTHVGVGVGKATPLPCTAPIRRTARAGCGDLHASPSLHDLPGTIVRSRSLRFAPLLRQGRQGATEHKHPIYYTQNRPPCQAVFGDLTRFVHSHRFCRRGRVRTSILMHARRSILAVRHESKSCDVQRRSHKSPTLPPPHRIPMPNQISPRRRPNRGPAPFLFSGGV